MATAEMVRVKLRQSFAGTGWAAERGDEIDVPVTDARRMVTRGLAERPEKADKDAEANKLAFDKAMRMTPAEQAEARRIDHKSKIPDHLAGRLGLRKNTEDEGD